MEKYPEKNLQVEQNVVIFEFRAGVFYRFGYGSLRNGIYSIFKFASWELSIGYKPLEMN
jgi:hypothetical protein